VSKGYFNRIINALSGGSQRHGIRQKLARLPHCSISESFSYEEGFVFTSISDDFTLDIGDEVRFRNYCHLLVYPGARLTIHKGVFLNNYCSVNCLGSIEIGENTLFGEGVKIYDHNHRYEQVDGRLDVKKNEFKTGFVKIGRNSWIGSNTTILANVEIGDNVIVGANCLVYKSIPSNVIVKAGTDLSIENLPGH
jgi:acetyltransferase-like isoleucine patch superfamily enzyme